MASGNKESLLYRSWRVLRNNPKLLVFPVGSVLGFVALVMLVFASYPSGHHWSSTAHWSIIFYSGGSKPEGVFAPLGQSTRGVILYVSSVLGGTFMNVALYHEILQVYGGDAVCIRRGLAFACTRLCAIITWSLFAATIGLVMRVVDYHLKWLGRLGLTAVSAAWGVATIFAIPVIIRDASMNPIRIVRTSTKLVRDTWGEVVYSFFGIQVRYTLLALLVFGLLIAARIAPPVVPSVCLFVAYFMGMGLVNNVYRAALYICATEGATPYPYFDEDMDRAWRVRGRSLP